MNIVFMGCVDFSRSALQRLLLMDSNVIGIVTRNDSKFNSDFYSLESIAIERDIPCFLAEGNNQVDLADWIKARNPDIIYCFGWSYLLGNEILKIPKMGIVGYHPAALPNNRGRHPIIWALVLGLEETASTFFFMDEGADSGDILSQRFIKIEASDDAKSIYNKLTLTALEQIDKFTEDLVNNKYNRLPQNLSNANYWRKRSKRDGLIDWRMSATSIHNLVRALSNPYPGAHCLYNEEEIKIWKTMLINFDLQHIEPGKIIRIEDGSMIIKCGEGAIKLLEHEFKYLPKEGDYL
jgi:methionyl-tRNA formyltransferase